MSASASIRRILLPFLSISLAISSAFGLPSIAAPADEEAEPNALERQFLRYYRECQQVASGSSSLAEISQLPAYRGIERLGVRVVPFLVERGEKDPVLVGFSRK